MLELKIALRYLFSRKRHNAVNVISLISMGGVAVATMAIVIVLSVFNGFENLALQQLSVLDPPLRVVPAKGKVIENAQEVVDSIKARIPGSKPLQVLSDQVLIMVGSRQQPAVMMGVEPGWMEAAELGKSIIDGEVAEDIGGWPAAVMSVGSAVSLATHPYDHRLLYVFAPKRVGRINAANPMGAFRADSLAVAGVYRSGHDAHDSNFVILPLDNARQLLDRDSGASSVDIWNISDPAAAAKLLEGALPQGVEVLNRMSQQSSAFAMIAVEKWITFAMLAFILVIASFNIVSTLCLLVLEKRDNMHIMLAMGMTPKRISRIFVAEGWLISLTGGVVGMVLGVALTLAQQWGHFIKLGGDPARMIITDYPVELRFTDLLVVMALVAVIGLVTSALTTKFARKR